MIGLITASPETISILRLAGAAPLVLSFLLMFKFKQKTFQILVWCWGIYLAYQAALWLLVKPAA
jgi:hypothetical protein